MSSSTVINKSSTENVEKCPYGLKSKSRMGCNLPDSSKSFSEVIRHAPLNKKLLDTAARILRAKQIGNSSILEEIRHQLIQNELMNIVIYDVQASGVPELVTDASGHKTVSYPSIIQFSFFHPLSGRHLTSYVTPTKPISYEASRLTGIYNSSDLKFSLPRLGDKCNPDDVLNLPQTEYINLTLLDRPEISEQADKYFEDGLSANPMGVLESSVQDFLKSYDHTEQPLIFLDQSSKSGTRAPYFVELVDDIFEFLSAEDHSTTILLSHNGSRWSEPILRAELERSCSTPRLDELIFLDTKDLFYQIYNTRAVSLGESRKESFNTVVNVLSLWKTIEQVSEAAYNRRDIEFIYSKIAEEFYRIRKSQGL